MQTFNEKILELKKLRKEINQDINKFNERIVNCSTFYTYNIVEILIDIIRVYEGKQFKLAEYRYHPKPERLIITETAMLLLNYKKQSFLDQGTCHKGKVYALQKHGDGIVLNWDVKSANKKSVKFYDVNHVNELVPNIKLNKFPYIKEFIDFVISYRINKGLEEDISIGCLTKLKEEFIICNSDNIKQYHETVKNREEEKMQKEINENNKYRNKRLQKILRKPIGGNYEF